MTVTPEAPVETLPANQVCARVRRRFSFAMFADLVPGATFTTTDVPADKRTWLLTFDRDLTPDEAQAVADRLSSTDDADMADRAELRALAEAVAAQPTSPVRALLMRLTTRALDD